MITAGMSSACRAPECTRVYGNHASSMDMDITQDVFNEEAGKVVDNVDLIVVLDVPPSSTSDQ